MEEVRVRPLPAAADAAKREAERVKALRPGLTDAVAKAKATLTDAETFLAAAKQKGVELRYVNVPERIRDLANISEVEPLFAA